MNNEVAMLMNNSGISSEYYFDIREAAPCIFWRRVCGSFILDELTFFWFLFIIIISILLNKM
jgi:hypothetical protein